MEDEEKHKQYPDDTSGKTKTESDRKKGPARDDKESADEKETAEETDEREDGDYGGIPSRDLRKNLGCGG